MHAGAEGVSHSPVNLEYEVPSGHTDGIEVLAVVIDTHIPEALLNLPPEGHVGAGDFGTYSDGQPLLALLLSSWNFRELQ